MMWSFSYFQNIVQTIASCARYRVGPGGSLHFCPINSQSTGPCLITPDAILRNIHHRFSFSFQLRSTPPTPFSTSSSRTRWQTPGSWRRWVKFRPSQSPQCHLSSVRAEHSPPSRSLRLREEGRHQGLPRPRGQEVGQDQHQPDQEQQGQAEDECWRESGHQPDHPYQDLAEEPRGEPRDRGEGPGGPEQPEGAGDRRDGVPRGPLPHHRHSRHRVPPPDQEDHHQQDLQGGLRCHGESKHLNYLIIISILMVRSPSAASGLSSSTSTSSGGTGYCSPRRTRPTSVQETVLWVSDLTCLENSSHDIFPPGVPTDTNHGTLTQHLNESIGPCCAGKKMSDISMLYLDKEGAVVFGKLPNMKVERCGCSWRLTKITMNSSHSFQ